MAALDHSKTAQPSAPEWLRARDTRLRLQTIVRLRWLAVLGQSVTVIGAYWVLGIDLAIGACFAVIALSAWLNVALRIRYRASQRIKSNYAFIMLAYDILQLAALLYLTGGLENPFAFLLIAPVTVSASTLPVRITIALGVLTIIAATALTTFHFPLPWFSQSTLLIPFPYVMGVWAAVVSGILFIGLYSWRTAEEGRRMADALAAAAAHGLGTPLATIAVVTKELLHDATEGDPHYDDILLLRAQAERCRDILKELASRGEKVDIIVSRLPLCHLIEEIVEPHRLIAVPIEVTTGPFPNVEPESPGVREPVMQRNPGVIYGLGNLVENAVDFAAAKVDVDARWSEDEVRVVIADDGGGFPPNVLEQLGEPFLTTRPGESWGDEALDEHIGMGLGFFIAKTLLERSGAQLELANRPEPARGAVVTVVWSRERFEETMDIDAAEHF